jgi:hypothetical protein
MDKELLTLILAFALIIESTLVVAYILRSIGAY